jgi:eukaryotic-like serine/threonine-protein kinase
LVLPAGTVVDLDNHTWTIGAQLRKGGFGTVYVVTDENGNEAVAKLFPKDAGAERELLMGDSTKAAGYPNVVPILDQGEHADEWALVMPRADIALDDYVAQLGRPLTVQELLPILRDIATALAAIDGEVIHRDLKPPNVLRLNGSWCLADFGIAKYAAAATAPDTHKYSWTKEYAAPEQWRMQTSTSKTDVYAFGILAYGLLSGTLPFLGPDFRQQHLTATPPLLTVGTPQLRNLIKRCLVKAPLARPKPAEILEQLEKITPSTPTTSGLQVLAAANEEAVTEIAEQQQQASAEQEAADEAELLYASAVELFEPIGAQLIDALERHADMAHIDKGTAAGGRLFIAALRDARIGLDVAARNSKPCSGPFNVISVSTLIVTMPHAVQGYEGRSHSLWFCDAEDEGQFDWYEVAFIEAGHAIARPPMEPYALLPWEAPPVAFSHVMGTTEVDWFERINLDDLSDFVDRWLGWFGQATGGKLVRPWPMPENRGKWRE